MKWIVLVLLAAMAAVPGFAQKLTSEAFTNPSGEGALQPNWSTTVDGSALLSWTEPEKDDTYTLKYAVRRGTTWSETRAVAAHRIFFRHPAELPQVVEMSAGHWMAHWVENPEEGSEAEFVFVSSSTDGVKWTAPSMAHKDKSEVEHGLASMAAGANGEASILWLEMPKGEDGPAYLKRTIVDAKGKEIREENLDLDVCSCCPTAVAKTARGLLVAYRDHTAADIRDIAVIRFENGKWSPSKIVKADNWKLNACPINGPSLAAKGDHAAIAWHTGAGDAPKVQVIFSEDGGTTFGKSAVVSTGRAFGYASVVLGDDGAAIVSWLERKADGSALLLARVVSAAGVVGPTVQVAEGGQAAMGFPRLFHSAGGTFIAWGNSRPGSKVQTARLR